MKVLGIDTATPVASVALVEDGKLIVDEVRSTQTQRSSVSTINRANHAELLLPLLESVLSRAGVALSELSALATSIGPGSFTGLRIGLSTVKGLAYGWQIPVVAVPTLLAVAGRVTNWNGLICPFLDARKKEVYAAVFRREHDKLERLTDDLIASPERISAYIQPLMGNGEPCLFVGDGIRAYGALITHALGGRCELTSGDSYLSTAAAVARLGEKKWLRQESDPPGPLVPIYLRPSEAELKKGSLGR